MVLFVRACCQAGPEPVFDIMVLYLVAFHIASHFPCTCLQCVLSALLLEENLVMLIHLTPLFAWFVNMTTSFVD